MTRAEYYTDKTEQLLGLLPPTARILLAQASHPATTPLAQAVLMLSICTLYSRAWLSRDISRYVKREFYPQHEITEEQLTPGLLRPIRNIYLLCALPFYNYWNANHYFLEFLTYYLSRKLTVGTSVRTLLQETEWLADESTLDLTDALALANAPEPPTLEELTPGAREALTKEYPNIEELTSNYLNSLPKEIHNRQDLVAVARLVALLNAGQEQSDLPEFAQNLVYMQRRFNDWMRAIPNREALLLLPMDNDIHLLAECLHATPSLPRGIEDRLEGLPDDVGSAHIPYWLSDKVFAEGVRLDARAVGPIPYLLVVKPALPERITTVKFDGFEVHGDYLILRIGLFGDTPGNDLSVLFSFNVALPYFLRILMLAAAHRAFRLDIISSTTTGLTLVASHFLQLDDGLVTLFERVTLTVLGGLFGNSPVMFAAKHREGMASGTGADRFGGCEYAKSEWLLHHGSPIPTTVLDGPKSELWHDYMKQRQTCLTLLDELATATYDSESRPPPEHQVARATAAMEAAATTLRTGDHARYGEILGSDEIGAAYDLVPPHDTCFVHFGLYRRRVHAAWVVLNSSGRPEHGEIDFPQLELDDVVNKVNAWLSAAPEDGPAALTPVLEYLSTTLTSPLMVALGAVNAQNLVLSPTWFLHLVPLHATGISPTNLLMDRFTVTYCHSLRLLQRCASSPENNRLRIAAIGSPDSPGAASELRAIQALCAEARTLDGVLATRERVLDEARWASHLHFACHGVNHADPRCSALLLAGDGEQRVLSLPRVLRDGDFNGVTLVFLAACHSGRHIQQREHAVQDYFGLDAGFLVRGAQMVISSLWEVYGAASLLMSARFYGGITEGCSVPEAFAVAVDDLRTGSWRLWPESSVTVRALNQTRANWNLELEDLSKKRDLTHPFFWASFKLSGAASRRR